MIFWAIVIAIAITSIGLSFLSLRSLREKHDIKDVKKDLSKNRVLYQDSSDSRGG